eukprot:1100468-Pyramimonas_sp.AAC.1
MVVTLSNWGNEETLSDLRGEDATAGGDVGSALSNWRGEEATAREDLNNKRALANIDTLLRQVGGKTPSQTRSPC